MSNAAIAGKGLLHKYDKLLALDIDSIEIPAGQITAFVGPNGSGISTLMWVIALLLKPAAGDVEILGRTAENENQRTELRRQITLVFQRPLLFHGSVASNVAYGLRCRSLTKAEISERVDRALELVEITHLKTRSSSALSGGEAQRVALARALVLDTPILLLDEPTIALDRDFRLDFEQIIKQRVAERGTTVVVSTHERGFVRRVARNVVYLQDGRMVQAPDLE